MKLSVLICLMMSAFGIASASEFSISTMLVGGRIFELTENRQLTFREDGEVVRAFMSPSGKNIAYITGYDEARLSSIKTTGGRSTIILDGTVSTEKKENRERWSLHWSDTDIIENVWSPDGSLLAYPADRISLSDSIQEPGGAVVLPESWILIRTSSGADRGGIRLDGLILIKGIFWSPDAKSLAFLARNVQDGIFHIMVYELGSRSLHSVYSGNTKIGLIGWDRKGESILYMSPKPERKVELREISADGSNDRVVVADFAGHMDRSPDGTLVAYNREDGMYILNNLTKENNLLVKAPKTRFVGWSPNGKMLAFCMPQGVKDPEDERGLLLSTLWLSTLQGGKFGRMCVCPNNDLDTRPSWSSDSMSMAYISDKRLHVSLFTWRDPNAVEKVEAGMPLSENEEKHLLANQAKEIGTALMMYAMDNDDCLPSEEGLSEALHPFMKNKNLFFRPGTEQDVFQYVPHQKLGDIEHPADTVLGTMDAGYGWRIELYADGHCRVVEK